MAESLEYRKYKLKKHRANISNRFEVANRKLDKRSSLIKYPWKVFAFIFKNILYGFNYIDYTLSFIKRNQFDVDFLEYQILTRGMDTDEAISFLEEQNILLKDFVYRNKMTPEYQSKAIRSLDLLFSKYNVIKDSEEKSFISKTYPDWIFTVWSRLIDKNLVDERNRSDFALLMTNSPILNQIYWKKGLVKLVQFVEEGLDIGKIKRDDKREKSRAQFIIDYIMANFRPDPNIPNQKLTHYTEYRIKKAQNDRYSQDIDGREFFIFDKTDTN